MAETNTESSNSVFDILEQWESYLKSENINFQAIVQEQASTPDLSDEFPPDPPDKEKSLPTSEVHCSSRLRGPSR